MRTYLHVVLSLAGVTAACHSEPSAPYVAPAASARLESAELGEIEKVHVLDGVYLTSQPQPADFEQAAAAGVKTVLNLRKPGENTGFDQAEAVRTSGMSYVNEPFNALDEMTDELLDRVRTLLRDEQAKPILVYCRSANRVGAVWMAHRVIDDGLSLEAAAAEAREVGLGSAELEQRVRDYVQRRASAR